MGARIAHEVASNQAYVAGSIGPLGRPIEPIGHITENEAFEAFSEQVLPLHKGEVDLFILETFNPNNAVRKNTPPLILNRLTK